MPTGYTDILDETGDEFDWLERTLVRNFGVAFSIRENGFGMTFDEVDAAIRKPDSIKYETNRLREVSERLECLKDLKIAKSFYKQEIDARKRRTKEAKIENDKIVELHNRAKSFLNTIKNEKVSQFTKDVAEFGISQLEVVEGDTEPYIYPPIPAFKYWVKGEIDECYRNVTYYNEQIRESKEGDKERIAMWDTFCKDIQMLEKKYGKL
jgi:hypothetical protein